MRKTKYQKAARRIKLSVDKMALLIFLLYKKISRTAIKIAALLIWTILWVPAQIKSIKIYCKAKKNLRNKQLAKRLYKISSQCYKTILTETLGGKIDKKTVG